MAKEKEAGRKVVARNRRATHDYFIDERFEAGLVLQGTEVKSLREGRANIAEAYASERAGELFLVNATIPEYHAGNIFNHEPRRPRKLLLRRRELNKLIGAVRKQGQTLIPLQLYFNPRGLAKDRARPRPRQEGSRQARQHQRTRLAARERAPSARQGVARAASQRRSLKGCHRGPWCLSRQHATAA